MVSFFKASDAGAKMPKGCIFCHIPLESSDMEQVLQFKGYSGSRPSIWVLQVINPIIFLRISKLSKSKAKLVLLGKRESLLERLVTWVYSCSGISNDDTGKL